MNKNLNIQNTKTKALEIIDFSKAYWRLGKKGDYAVKNASFHVFPGEFHGFIGANGAGKTTTIKSIIGAYASFEGEVKIYGINNFKKEAKKRVGYIPEVANFPKKLNAIQYITFMSRMSGVPWKESKKIALQSVQDMGLENIMKRNPNTFSSGQKKKVLLAQALVHNPDVLVMDEPAANLDPQTRNDFFNILKNLQKKGKAIFISSHILAELDQYVDSVTILDNGKILFSGKVSELITTDPFAFEVGFGSKENTQVFQNWARGRKIIFKESFIQNSGWIYEFKNKTNKDAAVKFIREKKLDMNIFNVSKITLQEAYQKIINDHNRKGVI